MEGFTIVLLIGWLLLVASFITMYFLDQSVKKSDSRRNSSTTETA